MNVSTTDWTSRLLVMCNDVAFNQSLKVQTKTKTIYENSMFSEFVPDDELMNGEAQAKRMNS